MKKVYAGIDLSVTKIASFVMVDKDNNWSAGFWIPEKSLPRLNIFLRRKLVSFSKSGYLKITSGDAVDYDVVLHDIIDFGKSNEIVDIAFDPWQSTVFSRMLTDAGFQVVEFSQTIRMFSEVSKKYIASRPVFLHPVLKWMDGNLKFSKDKVGNIKPNRKAGDISGIISGLMAMSRACAPTQRQADGGTVAEI